MKSTFLAGVAVVALAGAAHAGEPVQLTDNQMDQMSAGATFGPISLSLAFVLSALGDNVTVNEASGSDASQDTNIGSDGSFSASGDASASATIDVVATGGVLAPSLLTGIGVFSIASTGFEF